MPFYPFGPPRKPSGGGKHARPGPPDVDQLLAMARQIGAIPPFVRDDEVMVVHMTVEGSMEFPGTPGEHGTGMEWRHGDPLPHTSRDFSDPPFAVTPAEWRDKLIDRVNAADDQDEFRFALMSQLGHDLVYSHDVPSDMAVDVAGEFADWLYTTYRQRP